MKQFLRASVNFGVILNFWCFVDWLLRCGLEGPNPVHLIPEIRQAVDHRPVESYPICLGRLLWW